MGYNGAMSLSWLRLTVFLTSVSLGIAALLLPSFSRGASFDVYVDRDYEGEEEGTKERPYRTLAQALAAALENDEDERRVSVASGTYKESATLGKEVKVTGAGPGKTVIAGAVNLEDETGLADLSVRTESYAAITAAAGADVRITNVEVRGFQKMGINALPGKGKLILRNLVVRGGKGKGFYIQRGRSLELSGSKVHDNAEEGVDIRDTVEGFVRDNEIYDNGEAGIEIIVGNAKMEISGNAILRNKASGIAAQFYKHSKSLGKIAIHKNTIRQNGKYGLDCNIPNPGTPRDGYWIRSLELSENVIEKNGLREINAFCQIIEAVEKDEEQDNQIIEDSAPLPEPTQPVGPPPEEIERERRAWDEVERLSQAVQESDARMAETEEALLRTGKVRLFFSGYDRALVALLEQERAAIQARIAELRGLLLRAVNDQAEESIEGMLAAEEARLQGLAVRLEKYEKKKGLFSRIRLLVL